MDECVFGVCMFGVEEGWACGTIAKQPITESRVSGGVSSEPKSITLGMSGIWHAMCVWEDPESRHFPGFSLFFFLPDCAKWGQWSHPEHCDCIQREDERENTHREGKETDREAAWKGKKKRSCVLWLTLRQASLGEEWFPRSTWEKQTLSLWQRDSLTDSMFCLCSD